MIRKPWMRCALLGLVVLSSLLVGGSASAQDNYDECIVRLTSNPAAFSCNVNQTATGDEDNIVKIDILIEQSGTTGNQNADVDLNIIQTNTGTGENRVEGTIKIVQRLNAQSLLDISQTQDASITGSLSSETNSGDVIIDLDPIIDMNAHATAKGLANVEQTQNPEIDLDVDLLSDSGDIDAQFVPTSAQKLVASATSGSIDQTQSPEGGIFLDVQAHSETGTTTVSATNDETQLAEASSKGAVDQEQFGPNILGIRLDSGIDDDADGTLKTKQQCNRDDCFQDNDQDCDISTAGDGNCTVDAKQSSDNTSNFQSCTISANTGECEIRSPDGQKISCGPDCTAECFSGEGEGGCFEGGDDGGGDGGIECCFGLPEIDLASAPPIRRPSAVLVA